MENREYLMKREEIIDVMSIALEGGIGYWCTYYELSISKELKAKVKAELLNPCREDYIAESLLNGGNIAFAGPEEDSDDDININTKLYVMKLEDFNEGLDKWKMNNPDRTIDDMDGDDADYIIQVGLFGEIIYG